MGAFVDRIRRACESSRSLLCVGLDPDPSLMPVPDVAGFNQAIVEATAGLACAYKPNLAFYEALGRDGMAALEQTVACIRHISPDAIIIGDAKRGDIGPSGKAYAKAMFEVWGFDAVTVNAWGGADTVEPFLEDESKGIFVWCRGSNPGSADLQDLETVADDSTVPVYQRLAMACADWNSRGNVGLVVGATVPRQLRTVREICLDMPLLVPGVGAQGGDLEEAVRGSIDSTGRLALINSSRGIIYASRARDFAGAARDAARRMRDAINAVLEQDGKGWSTN